MRNDIKMVAIDEEELENVVGGCFGCIMGLSDHCTGKDGNSLGSFLGSLGRMLRKWTK